jgi:ribosomal protein L11 methyltransferase
MIAAVLVCPRQERDHISGELYELGTVGVTEEDLPGEHVRMRAFFEEGASEEILLKHLAPWTPRIEPVEQCDWISVSRAQWQPVTIGKRLYLTPPWRTGPAPEGRIRIEMPPGQAYGTGMGVPTQLALEAMEHLLKPDDDVLDLGTGSGLVAAVAARLGAGKVVACDIDVDVLTPAREFTKKSCGNVLIFAGSVRSMRSGCMDLVVANIHAEALVSLAGEIQRVLKPNGTVVLAGFVSPGHLRVHSAYVNHGFSVTAAYFKEEWVCLTANKVSQQAAGAS